MYDKVPYFYGIGRRKSPVARVGIYQGAGKVTINDRNIDDYFGLETPKLIIRRPLELINVTDKFDVICRATGGGVISQAGVIRYDTARALLQYNSENLHFTLGKAGFLTRGPGAKEHKKYGLRVARHASQFSKR